MRKVLVFVMALSLSVMLLGCSGTDTSKEAKDTTQDTSQEDKQDTSQEKAEPTQDKTEQKDEQVEENDSKEEDSPGPSKTRGDSKEEDSGNHEAQDQILKLYYISDSEEIECAEIRTNLLQTTDIWNGLIGEGVLSSECKMNSCNVDQEQKTIDLDVDSGTGSYIRSMGTTGEEQILTCIKKSFLKTYECERLKITENGQPLETGHTVLKGYMTADE